MGGRPISLVESHDFIEFVEVETCERYTSPLSLGASRSFVDIL